MSDERTALLSQTQPRVQSRDGSEAGPDTEQDPTKQDAADPSTKRLILILSGSYILTFLVALDSTLIATLAAPISDEFDDFRLLIWLASGFFIANIVSQPLAGRATDIFGRQPGIVVSATLFCIGNIICAQAASSEAIITGRILAGIGGGALGPIATFCIGDMVPLRSRSLWIGTLNTFFGLGSSIGGPLGGFIHDQVGWRWAFWVQVPPTIIAVILIVCFLRIPNEPAAQRQGTDSSWNKLKQLDIGGAATLTGSLTFIVFAINAGGTGTAPWTSPLVLITLVVGILLFPVFVLVELRHPLPIVPLSILLHNRTTSAAGICLFCTAFAFFGVFFFSPIYFLAGQGLSTTQAGLRLIPSSIATGITSIAAGAVLKMTGRYYFLNLVLLAIYAASFAIIVATFGNPQALAIWLPFVVFFFVGVGYAGVLSTAMAASVAATDQADQAVITGLSYVFRSTGSTLGIAFSSTIFQNTLAKKLEELLGKFGEEARKWVPRVRDNLNDLTKLPDPAWRHAATLSYVQASQNVWWLLLGVTILAFIAGALMKEHRLHKRIDRTDENDAT